MLCTDICMCGATRHGSRVVRYTTHMPTSELIRINKHRCASLGPRRYCMSQFTRLAIALRKAHAIYECTPLQAHCAARYPTCPITRTHARTHARTRTNTHTHEHARARRTYEHACTHARRWRWRLQVVCGWQARPACRCRPRKLQGMCIDTCTDICIDICTDMCTDMCVGMCVGLCRYMPVAIDIDNCSSVSWRGTVRSGTHAKRRRTCACA